MNTTPEKMAGRQALWGSGWWAWWVQRDGVLGDRAKRIRDQRISGANVVGVW